MIWARWAGVIGVPMKCEIARIFVVGTGGSGFCAEGAPSRVIGFFMAVAPYSSLGLLLLVNCRETAAPIVTTGAVLKRRYSMARNSLGKNRCMTSKSCGTRARSTCALKKIGNGTLEDYHAIRRTRLCLLNESDQVLAKCGTNQIKRRIIEPKGQYAGVDL